MDQLLIEQWTYEVSSVYEALQNFLHEYLYLLVLRITQEEITD